MYQMSRSAAEFPQLRHAVSMFVSGNLASANEATIAGITGALLSPAGREIANFNTGNVGISRLVVDGKRSEEGFWLVRVGSTSAGKEAAVQLDPRLPQWLSIDPEQPLRIEAPIHRTPESR